MRPDNTASIITAARQRHELTRAKAIQALRELDHAGIPVTFAAVAAAAAVSRSWLYAQDDLREEIERLRQATKRSPNPPLPTSQRASDASLLRRLEAAHHQIQQLRDERDKLRHQLAHALGHQRQADRNTPQPPP
jgi:Family of unknown function (DUF6262)